MLSLDGIGTVRQWVQAAKRKGLYGLAVTDHGDMSSMLELYTIGKEENFPIVMGSEIYLIRQLGDKEYYHLTVLVENFKGYQNLCRLSAISYEKGGVGPEFHFYKRPRVTFDELFAHKEGLIIGSGCMAGPVCKEVFRDMKLAEDHLKLFHHEFKDKYYVELQPSVVNEEEGEKEDKIIINKQEVVNKALIEFAKQYSIPTIITPDSHIIDENYKILQDIKLNMRSGKAWEFDESHHLFTPKELDKKVIEFHPYLEPYLDESKKNTIKITDLCQFKMPKFESLLPEIEYEKHPLYHPGATPKDLLIEILIDNGRINFDDPVHLKRLKYELDALIDNGTIDLMPYFFLLEEVVRWCRENHIVVGLGRGSAAGSLLCYGLGITHVDPIKYNLSFDRFINKARIIRGTFPDVDLDFSDAPRVKKFISEKYSRDRVAAIGVFQTLKAKGAIKDVIKKLRPEMNFFDVNNLTKQLPNNPQGTNELEFYEECLLHYPKLKEFMDQNSDVHDAVTQLLGQSRQRGKHACALVVANKPLTDILPLWQDNGEYVTQYSADWCKKAGVIKFDILSLNTLKDIAGCVDLVRERHGVELDIYNLPEDDERSWKAFQDVDTSTVFQFHTSVSKELLKKMKVTNIHHLAAITSLGRPGPMDMGMDKVYIDRYNGNAPIQYPHDSLKEVLADTYGVLVYQEQIMQAVQILGGFNAEEADDVRRCMGSKNRELLQSYKQRFLDFAISNYKDIDWERGNKLWDLIESFARYGFNSSHAYSYAITGYICQYLRMNYPLEWYCSVFSNASKDDRKEMYPLIKSILVFPDINDSKKEFYIKDNKIISSLGMINGVGEKSLNEILPKQPFTSLKDFFQKVPRKIVGVDVVLSLIFAGAFKSIEPNKSLQELVDEIYSLIEKKTPTEISCLTQLNIILRGLEALPIQNNKYEHIFIDFIKGKVNSFNYVLNKAPRNKEVSVVGQVEEIEHKNTSKGDPMMVVKLINDGLKMRVMVWPEKVAEMKDKFEKSDIVQVHGSVNIWKDTVSLVAKSINKLEV